MVTSLSEGIGSMARRTTSKAQAQDVTSLTFGITRGNDADPFPYVTYGDVVIGRITESVDAEGNVHNVLNVRIPRVMDAPRYVDAGALTDAQSRAFKAAIIKAGDAFKNRKGEHVPPKGAYVTRDALYVTTYASKYAASKIAARVPLTDVPAVTSTSDTSELDQMRAMMAQMAQMMERLGK